LKSWYLTFTFSGLQSHHCEGLERILAKGILSDLLLLLLLLAHPVHPKKRLAFCDHDTSEVLSSTTQ
jgi:hypothetical protein